MRFILEQAKYLKGCKTGSQAQLGLQCSKACLVPPWLWAGINTDVVTGGVFRLQLVRSDIHKMSEFGRLRVALSWLCSLIQHPCCGVYVATLTWKAP